MPDLSEINPEDRFVGLTNSNQKFIVDPIDYIEVIKWKWYLNNTKGAILRTTTPNLMLTHFIFGGKQKRDHIDRNPFNNKRNNFRLANSSQNGANIAKYTKMSTTSKYKGVCWHEASKKWMAQLHFKNKRIYIGVFKEETDAAQAYNFIAFEKFGEFAVLNSANKGVYA